ncbi:golgi-body localization protein domain-containing protein [Gorgonomyces haynaldii]|nr:golgi-body localization protein domain-containing protein [Gorgonomyces haynaldii]
MSRGALKPEITATILVGGLILLFFVARYTIRSVLLRFNVTVKDVGFLEAENIRFQPKSNITVQMESFRIELTLSSCTLVVTGLELELEPQPSAGAKPNPKKVKNMIRLFHMLPIHWILGFFSVRLEKSSLRIVNLGTFQIENALFSLASQFINAVDYELLFSSPSKPFEACVLLDTIRFQDTHGNNIFTGSGTSAVGLAIHHGTKHPVPGIVVVLDQITVFGDHLIPFLENPLLRKKDAKKKSVQEIIGDLDVGLDWINTLHPNVLLKISNVGGIVPFKQSSFLCNIGNIRMLMSRKEDVMFGFQMQNIVLDRIDIPNDSRNFANLFSLDLIDISLRLNAQTVSSLKHWRASLYCKSPHVTIEDQLLLEIVELLPPAIQTFHVQDPVTVDLFEKLDLAKDCQVQHMLDIQDLRLRSRFQKLSGSSLTSSDALVTLRTSSIVFVQDMVPSQDLVCNLSLKLQELSLIYSNIPSSLTDIDTELINPALRVPSVSIGLRLNQKQSHLDVNVSSVDVDLFSLVRMQSIDSFSVAVRTQTILQQLKKLQKKSSNKTILNPFNLSANGVLDRLQVSLVSESEPYHCISLALKHLEGSFASDQANVKFESVCADSVTFFKTQDQTETECLRIGQADLVIKNILQRPLISGTIASCKFELSLTKIYVAMLSMLFPVKLAKFFEQEQKQKKEPPVIDVDIQIPNLSVLIDLPDNVPVLGQFSVIHLTGQLQKIKAEIESIHGFVAEHKFEFLIIQQMQLTFIPPHLEKPVQIQGYGDQLLLIIPADYPFSNLTENAIYLNKAIKVLQRDYFGRDSKSKFELGQTILGEAEFPGLDLGFRDFQVKMLQLEFEAKISRNYKLGFALNRDRLSLERAFLKEAKLRGIELVGNASFQAVLDAYKKSMQFNAELYIKKMSEETEYPPLFHLEAKNLHGTLRIADLDMCIEEKLHQMDATTPPNLFYDDLVPLEMNASLSCLQVRLRDFEIPLAKLQDSRWETKGLVIVADPSPGSVSVKNIALPLDIKNQFIYITKNMNPVKIYTQTSTNIHTDTGLFVCAGVGYEPTMADVIAVIDSFTKPTSDPSPPIGWWDKLRLVLHGSNTLQMTGSGVFSMRILGSYAPDYDPRNHVGTSGIQLVLSNGIDLKFGEGNRDAFETIIRCGKFRYTLPEPTIKENSESKGDTVIGVFNGDISILLLWDAFAGFKSSSMHLTIDVSSPVACYTGTVQPLNAIFLNSVSLANLQTLITVYQSVLTNVPIKRGKLFNADYKSIDKPKLGNTLREIRIKIEMQPIVVTSISEFELLSGGVGLRVRSEQLKVEGCLYQFQLRHLSEEKKPVTKWNAQSMDIVFSEVEGRVLDFDSKKEQQVEEETPNITFFFSKMVKSAERVQEAYQIQRKLYLDRLQEIDQTKTDLLEQRTLIETRASIMFDASEQYKIQDIDQQLVDLRAKRDAVERILNDLKPEQVLDLESELFQQNYIVHNIQVLWNEHVRNCIFKIFELQSKDFRVKYCLSNTASGVVNEICKSMSNKEQPQSRTNLTKPQTGESRTKQLLEKLLKDLKMGVNVVVEDTTTTGTVSSTNTTHLEDTPTDIRHFLNSTHMNDGKSIAEYEIMVKLLNPQVSFEVETDKKSSILVGAPNMEFKSALILDARAVNRMAYDDKDRADMIIKTRSVISLSRAQFFATAEKEKWPLWVTVECLDDCRLPTENLSRIIHQADLLYHRDKLNPLYIDRQSNESDAQPDTFSVTFPKFQIEVDATQLGVWMQVISQLLVYRDPDSGDRAIRLKKMMIALEQMDNYDHIRDTYMTLQEKLRKLDVAVNNMMFEHRQMELRKLWATARNELYVYMEALKNIRQSAEKRHSVHPSWDIIVKINEFSWTMMSDGQPFATTTLANIQFVLVNNEDQSSVNTLEVDSLHMENLMPQAPSGFRDVLSTYDKREINYSKHKAFRLYWRENPPVGGIPVIDHFELNIVPLVVQTTYDFGKQFMNYIFTERAIQKKTPETIDEQVDLSTGNLEIAQMQQRAQNSRSFIYVKVPTIQIGLSYKGTRQNGLMDLPLINFQLPTLEYRNRTWTWYELFQAVKRGF